MTPKSTLCPEDVKPRLCRQAGCEIETRRPGPDEDQGVGCFITHRSGEHEDEMPIPLAWVEDVRRDIWQADVKPWIRSLHEPWPCPTCGKPR